MTGMGTWKTPKRGKAHSKAVAQGKLVETANDLSLPDFMSKYGPLGWRQEWDERACSESNGNASANGRHTNRKYSYTDGSNISPEELEGCLNLIEHTSAEDYANSEMGWSRTKKRKEMVLPDMKYIIQQQEHEHEQGNDQDKRTAVGGFISFMITYEDGEEVVYIYEVHLQPASQGKGYGRSLMELVEQIGQNVGVTKAMLTVFRSNQRAISVYERLGYAEDDFSPKPRRLRNGAVKEPSYVILSKALNRVNNSRPG